MKTFIYTKQTGNWNRKTGSTPYSLRVYEIVNKDTIKLIGTVSTDTAHHKGELCEAWVQVFNSLSTRKQKGIEKFYSKTRCIYNFNDYVGEKIGISIIGL